VSKEDKQLLGSLYVLAAPSGAGKTSLVKALLQSIDQLEVSVSYTTRARRSLEQEGRDYFFVDDAQFAEMVAQDAFLEHATVFGHSYGTAAAWVISKLTAGIDVILEIDWQGAQQVCQAQPNTVSIFILPPSLPALQQRLEGRAQDDAVTIESRMVKAKSEMSHHHKFDYLVINDDFQQALQEVSSIIRAQRLISAKQRLKYAELLPKLV